MVTNRAPCAFLISLAGSNVTAATILVLVTDAFGGSGGIAQYNRDLITALAAGGHRIDVLPRLAPDPVGPLPNGVSQLPARFGRSPSSLLYCVASLAENTTWFSAATLTSLRWRRSSRGLRGRSSAYRPWDRGLATTVGAATAQLRGADLILAVSRDTRAKVLTLAGIAPERVIVLPTLSPTSSYPAAHPQCGS